MTQCFAGGWGSKKEARVAVTSILLSQTQSGNPGGDTNSPEWCGAKNRAEWLAQCTVRGLQLLQMALCNTLRALQPAVI